MKIIICGDGGLEMTGIWIVTKNLEISLNKYAETINKSYTIKSLRNFFKNYFKETFIKLPLLKGKEDEIFFSTHSLSISPKIIAFFSKGRKAIMVHDLFYLDMHKYEFNSLLMKFGAYLTNVPFWKSSLRRYDLIFAISNKTKQDLIANGFDSDKIIVSYIGIDDEYFQPMKPAERPIEDDYIFAIGTEQERKNMKGIIEAFSIIKIKYPKLKLLKAGYGVLDEYRMNTLKLINEINPLLKRDIVFFNQRLTIEEIKKLYVHSKLLLFPSLKEGFGLPIIEAQAIGTPVITRNKEPMSELIPYKELLVDAYDSNDIAEKCCRILENDKYRKKIIEDGKAFAARFTWDKTAKVIYHELSKLMK